MTRTESTDTAIRVDAHHHVWCIGRGDYGWLTPDLPICRDYGLDELRRFVDDDTRTLLVQAAPTEAETDFLLDTARASVGLVQGVVGWVDLSAPDASSRIESRAQTDLLKGLRPMLQDIADTEWILRESVQSGLQAMQQAGLRFDALVQPRHLPVVRVLAGRYPGLRIAIDHGAKPGIADGSWQPWAGEIARIARDTPAFCKLSGLVTEAGPNWTLDVLRPYVDHLLECFGPGRIIWGSDWPVVDLAGGYAQWREATLALLSGLSQVDQDAVLGTNAVSFYGL